VRAVARALRQARRALATEQPEACISVGPPGSAHLVARAVMRPGVRWTAHVTDEPRFFREDRWGRVLDPRARALRRADVVTAPAVVADALHQGAGVSVVPADESAKLQFSAPAIPGAGRLRLLMLGTVNSPHVEHLALAMHERGHRVVVAGDVVPAYPPSILPQSGVDVRPLELPAMPWAIRLARELRPDVVHANWLYAYAFLATVTRLRPLVAMAWGSDVYRASPFQLRQIRFVLRRAQAAVADSADLVDRLVSLGADPAKTHLLNWGVDLTQFRPAEDRAAVRRCLGLGDGPIVLSPRTLTPLYNPAVIAEAFERAAEGIPDATLVLKHMATTAPDIGRPLPAATHVIGHVPYEQLPDWYRAADVCVSIPDSDSSPRSVWEAMACGCPCVLSDLPWVHELIEPGRHALVVARDVPAVAAAIRRLLEDPAEAARIGSEAQALVAAHRDQRVEMDRLEALYRGLALQSAP
jgi:glycosyltransferase involved in cell wall biosynthesis